VTVVLEVNPVTPCSAALGLFDTFEPATLDFDRLHRRDVVYCTDQDYPTLLDYPAIHAPRSASLGDARCI
jgi:hypothetical protein